LNLVDLLLLVFVALFTYRGYKRGVIAEALDVAGLVLGLVAALRLYPILAAFFRLIGFGRGVANGVSGILIFAGFVLGAVYLARRIYRRMGPASFTSRLKAGGAALAVVWASLFGGFAIVMLTVLPSPPIVQRAIPRSFLGRTALAANSPVYGVFEGFAEREARNLVFYVRQYLARFEPKPDEPLDSHDCFDIQASSDIKVDSEAEGQLLAMVNKERIDRGIKALRAHQIVREVARRHSADMYKRGYFCHASPDGLDPFERMSKGVIFDRAGENLALAPTIEMVHRGLMNSPKHKENILRTGFTDLGIGVYRGPSGLMVTQNFCSSCR
jgi:uncharacterized protein YkwD